MIYVLINLVFLKIFILHDRFFQLLLILKIKKRLLNIIISIFINRLCRFFMQYELYIRDIIHIQNVIYNNYCIIFVAI